MRHIILSVLLATDVLGQNTVTQTIDEEGLGDFTTVAAWESQNLNLVTFNQRAIGQIEGMWSAYETLAAGLTIAGWTTDATRNLTLEAVGEARHRGLFAGGGRYTLFSDGAESQTALRLSVPYATLHGFQVLAHNTSSSQPKAVLANSANIRLSSLLVRRTLGDWGSQVSYGIDCTSSGLVQAFNCVADGFTSGFYGSLAVGGDFRLYNCTSYNCIKGYDSSGAATFGWNNCLAVTTSGAFAGFSRTPTFQPSTGNISTLEIPPGTNAGKQAVISLAEPLMGDYHLDATDLEAIGYGVVDPASGLYSDDYEGHVRGSSWDTGADQLGSSAPTGSGQVIITSQ